ncbi:MAG: class I SAM-dependent methyltransferase [Gemmatimonadales bacterium]
MTTPSLYRPRAPLRPTSPRTPSLPPQSVEEVRAAAVRDLLEPYLVDCTHFTALICDELRDPVARPRIIEFGCGTGHLTWPALATRPDAVYHGFDGSEARVAVALHKLIPRGLHRCASFTTPLKLDHRAIGEALQGLRADFLLLPRFLQTVPLCATDGGGLHRVAFLALCQQLVKPGGRIFIIEAVFGEDADEQARLSLAWSDAFRARLTADLERLRYLLQVLDPELAARLARLPGDPSLLGELENRARPDAAQVLPLSAWEKMFEHLGFTYRTVEHETQKQLFLFTVRC